MYESRGLLFADYLVICSHKDKMFLTLFGFTNKHTGMWRIRLIHYRSLLSVAVAYNIVLVWFWRRTYVRNVHHTPTVVLYLIRLWSSITLGHIVHSVADICRLLSTKTSALVAPRTVRAIIGDRTFPAAAASVWNSLPESVRASPPL